MIDQTHLLVICPSLQVGGAERQLSLLVPALQARGFEPTVVTIRDRGRFFDELSDYGVSVRFLEVRARLALAGIRKALAAVGAWPDAVLTQSLDAQLVGRLIARRARGAHTTIHDGEAELRSSLHRRWLTRFVASRVDRVIAVTESQREHLIASGFADDRIAVIANGVSEPSATRARAEVRSEFGLGTDDFVAVLAATLRPEKRAAVFLDAVARANDMDSSTRGVIAGQGPDLQVVISQARRQGVVSVLGERSGIADLIAACGDRGLRSNQEASPMAVVHEVIGLLTPIDQGQSLAAGLAHLSANRRTAAAMGAAGRSSVRGAVLGRVDGRRLRGHLRQLLEVRRT